ncbi:MAG: hypothetical protein HY905_10600 [Deltaproteobacteria bacterium]|nr:hypothetical protein [Deltaproteobacteria bacterium]
MRKLVWIAMLVLAMGACKKKSEGEGGGNAAPPPAGGGGGNAAKAAALKAAWEANADCQSLVKCCAAVPGTTWEATIGVVCEQVKTYQNFEEQANNLVDPAWQDTVCKNTLDSTGMMGNEANPVPEGCKRAAP